MRKLVIGRKGIQAMCSDAHGEKSLTPGQPRCVGSLREKRPSVLWPIRPAVRGYGITLTAVATPSAKVSHRLERERHSPPYSTRGRSARGAFDSVAPGASHTLANPTEAKRPGCTRLA